jgi:hypothetical protein
MNYTNEYFASMNTGDGFCSFFDEIFDPAVLDAYFIIKGGSGTGKSTMMKKISDHFQKKGFLVERFYCSSDINSLDGILIDERVAVVDGTAPHTTDPKYPGAVDEIINLSECWDTKKLKSRKKEIINYANKKSSFYRKGYSFLGAAYKIKREIEDIVLSDYNYEKMSRAINRFLKQNGYKGEGKGRRVRLVKGIGAYGISQLKSLEKMSDKICCITNGHECEGVFLREFLKCAEMLELKSVLSYDPVCHDEINALYFPEVKLSVVISDGSEDFYDEKYKAFNLERFIDKNVLSENRSKLRFAKKCLNSLVEGACDAFEEAKVCHGQIEAIYSGTVDFKKVGNITDTLIDRINSLLQ